MVRVSIITIVYNSEQTIFKAIESVLNQSVPPYEYIIIDGASKDDTVKIAESYRTRVEQKGINYLIVSESDTGISDAMNKGIRLATGDIIGMINSDDWYEPIAVETVSQAYENSAFDWFYADVRIIKPSGNFVKRSRYDRFPSTRHWNHPTTFISKKVYNQYQYLCKDIADDWDLMLRLRNAGYKPVISNVVLANFVYGGCSNQTGFSAAYKRFLRRYEVYRRNGYSRLCIFECALMELAKLLMA